MDKKKECTNHFQKIKSYYKILDGFSLKYVPMFLIISAATNIVLKNLFHKEFRSRLTVLAIMIIALAISLLWTKLVLKTEISIFDRPLTKYHKKQALSRRGTAIVIFYLILKAIPSGKTSDDIVTNVSRKLIEVSFSICVIVLMISFLIIVVRRTKRPVGR